MTQTSQIIELQEIIKSISNKIRKQDFLTYFHKMSIIGMKDGILTLGVVSEFVRDNINFKFCDILTQSAQEIIPAVKALNIVVDIDIDTPSYTAVIDCLKVYKTATSETKKEARKPKVVGGIEVRKTQDKYRLENFVVGSGNKLAYAASEAVAKKPGTTYNPMFIYSDVGLGKTHLLQATGNSIKKKHPDKRVVYMTADRFVDDYVNSVKNRTTDQLRKKYRAIDVLLLDDVQFLAGKKQTQEELYSIFNMMYDAGKQVVFSSDRPPRELTNIEPRLMSRFEWGIMVDMDIPDFETKLAILQQKAREREFILPQDVAEYLAYNLGKNIRELEGLLNQIVAEFELYGTAPTIESITIRLNKLGIAHDTIGTSHDNTAKFKKVSYKEILTSVSQHFGIDQEDIMGNSRSKQFMIPRQVAMYLLKNKMNFTYERIGNIFNGRQHSAVMYSCRKLEQILKKDQQLFYEINMLREKL